MKKLTEIYQESQSSSQYAEGYLNHLSELLMELDVTVIEQIIDCFLASAESENVIYFIGNGGSAVTATHFASDIAINTSIAGKKPIRAVSLADNQAILTCIGNDEGFENIFVRQLEFLLRPNDVVFAMSVSGNSPNIVKAVDYAKHKGAVIITCTGFDGGKIAKMADIALHITTPEGEYGPVEDIFQILDHLIYSYLRLARVGKLVH